MSKKLLAHGMESSKVELMQNVLDVLFLEAHESTALTDDAKEQRAEKAKAEKEKATDENTAALLESWLKETSVEPCQELLITGILPVRNSKEEESQYISRCNDALGELNKKIESFETEVETRNEAIETIEKRRESLKKYVKTVLYDTSSGRGSSKIVTNGLYSELGITKSFLAQYYSTKEGRENAVNALLASYGLKRLNSNIIDTACKNIELAAGKVATSARDTKDGKLLKDQSITSFQKIMGRAICTYLETCCNKLFIRDNSNTKIEVRYNTDDTELVGYTITDARQTEDKAE